MSEGFPTAAQVMTFIATRDRAVAQKFYGETLGFQQINEDEFAVVFDLNGTPLRISTVPDHEPPIHTVLGWAVPDIVATVRALQAKGVKFNIYEGFGQDKLGIWTAPTSGDRVAWFLDPDGNNLSLTQFAK
jgi:catechol 2,3-dioxygenase-like lactoylglutathione lyase family enzyme